MLQICTEILFEGVSRLEQAEANVQTTITSTPEGCTVRSMIQVHNKDTTSQFVESGIMSSLVKAADKWVAYAYCNRAKVEDSSAVLEVPQEAESPLAEYSNLCHGINGCSVFLNLVRFHGFVALSVL